MNFDIICASYDTPQKLKAQADYVCPEEDARPVLQAAIDEADALGVKCVLLRGTYIINSCGERSKNGAICFFNPEEKKFIYKNVARYHILEGAVTPLGWLDGAVVTLGKEFYDSLSDTEEFSVFYTDGGDWFARGMYIKNIVVRLPGNYKPVIVFDASCASAVRYEDDWVTSVHPDDFDPRNAEGIPVPNAASTAFRGCTGSNFFSTEWKNCAAIGFGTGFAIGGEHVYCESLSALYNIYGFTFDCYKGKDYFDMPKDAHPRGVVMYPITCVNLLDEHSINLPKFGNTSHCGETPEGWAHSITIRGMNIQWPNTAPGYTDREAADFLKGRSRATEIQPGSWRGSVEAVLDHTQPGCRVFLCDEPFFEEGHGTNITFRSLHAKPDKE